METALVYEYIIRTVFQCGRTAKFGADADVFRGLERKVSGKNVSEYEKGVAVGRVATNIFSALFEIREKRKDNQEFCEQIEECLGLLYEPTFEKVCQCIDKTQDVFAKHRLPL